MTQHKWHKEIKAWADGAEIECQNVATGEWEEIKAPYWSESNKYKYRIKPQPKEPQYLYVWHEPNYGKSYITANTSVHSIPAGYEYLGKIPLIVENNDD